MIARRGRWGSRWGRKMAEDQGGACASTSSTIPTHTLAFGQSHVLKKATPVLQLLAGLFPREPAVPGLGQAGAGMPRPSWHADRQGATEAAEPGGRPQPGSSARKRSLASWGGGMAEGKETRGRGPFLWLLCHPGTDLLPARCLGQLAVPSHSLRSLSRGQPRPPSAHEVEVILMLVSASTCTSGGCCPATVSGTFRCVGVQ